MMQNNRSSMRLWAVSMLSLMCATQVHAAEQTGKGPVQVFILAGDSNCEGKAAIKLMEHLLADPATAATYKHLQTADGQWAQRDDVWMKYFDRHGKLSMGYGSSAAQFGIELQIGNVLGDRLENQVLLIKTAWGGSGLGRNFNAPHGDAPAGELYVKMIEEVQSTLKNLKTLFPEYDEAKGYEIAGLVWFSGWNDAGLKDYEEKLAQFIAATRNDLHAPDMPVVIGELGVSGPPADGVEKNGIRLAQMAVAERKELRDTVKYVKTAEFFDLEAFKMFRDGSWARENKEAFAKRASDRPYHFMGSAKTFFEMGQAMGEAMAQLVKP